MDEALVVILGMVLCLLIGAVGALIGYNVGVKKPDDDGVVAALCRTLDSAVAQNTAQSRRAQDMASLSQEQQIDRINAEYVAETAYRSSSRGVPVNGYIEEPEPMGDQYDQEIP
jgi:hypothetical protein